MLALPCQQTPSYAADQHMHQMQYSHDGKQCMAVNAGSGSVCDCHTHSNAVSMQHANPVGCDGLQPCGSAYLEQEVVTRAIAGHSLQLFGTGLRAEHPHTGPKAGNGELP